MNGIKYVTIMVLCCTVMQLRAQMADSVKAGMDMTGYVFKDTADREVALKDFKGKYILLDVWASWCRPCINAFPAYDSLKQVYKDKNIAFLQVSCDASKMRWTMGMGFTHRTGLQVYLAGDRHFMQELKVATIPRLLLIDREGRLLNGYMSEAAAPRTKEILEHLEGI